MKITTLRTTADEYCPTDRTCPSVHEVDIDPEHRYVIFKPVAGGPELATFRSLLGEGEVLGYMPAGFIPAGNPLLERTRSIRGQALRSDRQYVITKPVLDPTMLRQFAHLMAPDERLGVVAAHELVEV